MDRDHVCYPWRSHTSDHTTYCRLTLSAAGFRADRPAVLSRCWPRAGEPRRLLAGGLAGRRGLPRISGLSWGAGAFSAAPAPLGLGEASCTAEEGGPAAQPSQASLGITFAGARRAKASSVRPASGWGRRLDPGRPASRCGQRRQRPHQLLGT